MQLWLWWWWWCCCWWWWWGGGEWWRLKFSLPLLIGGESAQLGGVALSQAGRGAVSFRDWCWPLRISISRGDDHDDDVDAGVDDTKIRSIHTSAHSHGVVQDGDRKSNWVRCVNMNNCLTIWQRKDTFFCSSSILHYCQHHTELKFCSNQ